MNKALVVGVCILCLVGVGLFVFFARDTTPSSMPSDSSSEGPPEISWHFNDLGSDEMTYALNTEVMLEVDGKDYKLGTYTGSCFVIEESAWELLENEITGVICWWAGGGKEIGVFKENGRSVVKIGDIEESTEETGGFRGNFRSLFEIGNETTMTETGLIVEDTREGTGNAVVTGDTVSVHYVGTLTDGTKFDSSRDRGMPFVFAVGAGRVIKGWDEGLIGMKIGGMRKLTIPSSLAYGAAGIPGVIPPNATLVFEIELVGIE